MYYMKIVYESGVNLPEGIEPYSIDLGIYGFHEFPRIVETIAIQGTGNFKIKNIQHTFRTKNINKESTEFEYLTTIFV